MYYFKKVFKWFVIINTGILLILNINMIGVESVNPIVFWEVFPASAITSLITAGFEIIEPKTHIKGIYIFLAYFIHYVCLVLVMILIGYWFGWIDLNAKGILIIAASTAGVYLISFTTGFIMAKNEANLLNEALKNYNQ